MRRVDALASAATGTHADRRAPSRNNFLYAEFATGDQRQANIDFRAPDFYELFDMDADPWSLKNIYASAPKEQLREAQARVKLWYECSGAACP